jgi:hypothetical protein
MVNINKMHGKKKVSVDFYLTEKNPVFDLTVD